MNNQKRYNTYRMTFAEMVYEGYEYNVQSDGLHMSFTFRLNDKLVFRPSSLIVARPFLAMPAVHTRFIDELVFNIGMIELISYWKAFCSPVVRVVPHALTEGQIAFWKKLYFRGLGEFFYLNGLRATESDFMQIVCAGTQASVPAIDDASAGGDAHAPGGYTLDDSSAGEDAHAHGDVDDAFCMTDSYIVPIGGGKDSVVTLELLNRLAAEEGMECALPLVMNPRGATLGCCHVAGYERKDIIEIQRTIDPLLLDLNSKGALNGHTPFSAMLAFYCLLAAKLCGRHSIALSNEGSANEATDVASGVNHQYSKSLEFENDFRQYVAEYISPSFNYFSFLRPLSELQIASLFAGFTQYHDVFRSCNVGSKRDEWCGACAKCLFAFIILSPFIEPERLSQIFGHNLLDDTALLDDFRKLTGQEAVKPFECVGTVDEVRTALAMAIDRWYGEHRPALLRGYEPCEPTTPLHTLSAEHNLSERELKILQRYVL